MVDPSMIHALLIGINEYSKVSRLQGAINDALHFEKYLLDRQVPSRNIRKLLDSAATRAAIIEGFKSLQTHNAIRTDEAAIIIFYAGHGASSALSVEEHGGIAYGNQVEQLCPVDIGETTDSGQVIEGIPDRTIAILLDDLSRAKGNNITVILDCCYSAGMNRGDANKNTHRISRSIDNPPPLSGSFDADLGSSGTRGIQIAPDFLGTARESHILLAACSSSQSAHEFRGHGIFTNALLDVLNAHPLGSLTYTSLMHRLVLPFNDERPQTPHCEGKFLRRRLFDSWGPEAESSLIFCRWDSHTRTLILAAGAMHGVTVHSQYEIFNTDSPGPSSDPLTATIDTVEPFTSLLVPSSLLQAQQSSLPSLSDPIREVWYARLSNKASVLLHLYCSDEDYMQRLLKATEAEPGLVTSTFHSVADPSKADLILTIVGNKVCFERGPRTVIVPSFIDFPAALSGTVSCGALRHVRSVVNSYARFLSHLARTGSPINTEDILQFSFKRLEGATRRVMQPVGKELLGSRDIVTIRADPSFYGLTVKNLTDVRLFVNVFWFEPSTSEIILWCDPGLTNLNASDPGVRSLDTELEPGKVLTAGFGNGGVHPFRFKLNQEPIDVSLLKIFVSTTPTDMRSLEQPSPFEGQRKASLASWDEEGVRDVLIDTDFWMTKIITVVQKVAL